MRAVAVARAGAAESPPVRAPEGLRRVLGFARLQGPALSTIRRVVDEDAAFRARVADATDPSEVGEAGWLWLHRPEGWSEQLATLVAEADADDDERRAVRDVARLTKALAAAEEATRRHERAATTAQAAEAAAVAELAAERTARRDAEVELAGAREELVALAEQRSQARRAAGTAERELAAVRSQLKVARAALREAEQELATRPPAPPPADPRTGVARSDAGTAVRAGEGAVGEDRDRAVPAAPTADLMRVARRVADAAAAASTLAAALVDAAAELGPAGGTPPLTPAAAAAPAGDPPALRRDPSTSRHERRPSRWRRPRQPAGLPAGVWDDAPLAAAHLLRLPGAVVLVDGYNVARTAWTGLSPDLERERLLPLLDELHARTGAEIIVVFDGVEAGAGPARRTGRGVRVRFTATGVTADEVLGDLVGAFPVDRPVIVVSSDREVADGARAEGANAVSSRQLLASLGREVDVT